MRTRQINREFWDSGSIGGLTHFERLLFIGLWCMADREGLLKFCPARIKASIFPLDDMPISEVSQSVDSLISVGLVEKSEGVITLLYIPKFLEYQHIHPHEAASKLLCHYITGNVSKCKPTSTSTSTPTPTSTSTKKRGNSEGGIPPFSCPSDAQKKTMNAMAKERGVKLDDIIKNLGIEDYTSDDVTGIMAELKKLPKGDAAVVASVPSREMYAEVESKYHEGENGFVVAREWIWRQPPKYHTALLQRLKTLEAK